ncbi:hypothetical protein IHE45_02G078400 [Dioscorea alata]|nr:hypothetical protein IHE45_02G078400 [Dioscorea alata]
MVNQSLAQQAPLPQNISKNAPSTTIQNSTSLPPPMQGVTQNAMSHIGANSNLQNVSSMPQNSINSIAGQGATPNIYNSQRQMQGQRQPPFIVTQQHQQPPQNTRNYQQQLHQQLLKQKSTHPSLVQPHPQQQQQQQQQQSLLQQNQLQPSQQSLVQSNIPAGQSNIQQTQPTMMQTVQKSGLQNQQNSMQQSSLLQQHPQSIARQQQSQSALHQQSTSFQQQPSAVPQQSLLSSQQQQLMVQQSNMLAMQHNQLLGQQNNASDLQQQQQRLPGQQNNLLSVQQRQQILNQQSISLQQQQHLDTENNLSGQQQQQQLLGQQSNLPGLQQQQQQQQQQQLLGSQPGISSMQPHQMLQQNKIAIQRSQQPSLAMLQSQNQQSQHPAAQQQLMPQISSQPGQLQQHLGTQQQASSIQREMQQRLQTSGVLLQSQNAIEQQKQFIQPQRGLSDVPSSASSDSAVPTSNTGAVDWQEEIYQKITSMKDLYFVELNELFQKISLKFQQHESLLSGSKQSEHFEKMKQYKTMLERTLHFLQISKANIQPGFKEKLPLYEKQILSFLASSRGQKIAPSQSSSQPPSQPSGGHTQSTFQQRSSQVPQLQLNDNVNQLQQKNLQGSATSMQPSATPSMPHGSLPSSTASINPAQQSMVASSQNTMNGPQQTNNIHTLPQSSINTLQPNVSSMQISTNILQQQHLKQEQQQQPHLMQSQQFTQLQQRHTQQQQKQQIMQQQLQPPAMQQQLQQQKQQQTSQFPVNQMAQINQVNEEMKLRQGAGMKSGLYQQHFQAGQRHNFYHQQKSGSSLPSSSPQHIHISSPQISQQPSPQIDQQSLSSSFPKTGTPLQATSSPVVVPSPTTAIAPSPVPVDSEKPLPHVTLLTNAVSNGPQQTNLNPSQSSIAVGTPGISASPLLAEFVSPDIHQPDGPVFSGKPGVMEKPLERLIKVLQSVSPEVLCSSVSDIGTVISMTDRIAGSAPCNGSRAAVGEDLVAMTKCRLQARNFMSQDGSAIAKKMKRHLSALPLTVGSAENSVRQSDGHGISELESTVTPRVKRQKTEVSHSLLDEITEINNKLIGTVVSISDEDVDPVAVATAGSNEGTVIKCSYSAVALSPSLKSHFASAQESPILPLKLLVPPSYPNCSPILLDKPSVELSQDCEDLSTKAKSRFSTSLRGLPQPISLREMANTWDLCTQKVISEYAQRTGGGVFSSKYGAWENCVSA